MNWSVIILIIYGLFSFLFSFISYLQPASQRGSETHVSNQKQNQNQNQNLVNQSLSFLKGEIEAVRIVSRRIELHQASDSRILMQVQGDINSINYHLVFINDYLFKHNCILFTFLPISLILFLFIYAFIHLFIYLSIYPSICLSSLFIYLSIYLFLYLRI